MREAATWRYQEVHWGVTECCLPGCSEPAILLYDGEPLCAEGADALLDRQIALGIDAALAASLPPVTCRT